MASPPRNTTHSSNTSNSGAPFARAKGLIDSTSTTTTVSRRKRASAAASEVFCADNAIGGFCLRLSVALLTLKQRFNTWRIRQLREF